MKKIFIISGPTASGKTDTAISLAKINSAQIINFDSLLFYKELSIGTAKPSKEEMDGIVHHFVDTETITQTINAAEFSKAAIDCINELHSREIPVILVGGSGFYLQAILNGMYDSPSTPKEIIDKSNNLYNESGITPFIDFLKVNDKVSFEIYHKNDHYRIRRAVEHFWAHEKPFSQARHEMSKRKINSPVKINNWDVYHCFLDIPKNIHLDIIAQRTNKMLEVGLLEEVKKLISEGFTGEEKPLQSIGYKESVQYLNGEIESKEELTERINISTRQLAKAQRTWFKKIEKNEFNTLVDQELINLKYKEFMYGS